MSISRKTLAIGLSYFIKITSAFVVNKILAIFIGPSGIALIGQFRSFVQMLTTFSTGGINNGVVKLVSVNRNRNISTSLDVKNISVSICLVFSIFFAILLFIFHRKIGFYLFNSNDYSIYIFIFAISLILFGLNQIFLFFINGEGDVNLYVRINIIQSIIILLMSIILVSILKFQGALLVVGLSQVLVSFVSFYFVVRKKIFLIKAIAFKVKSPITKTLMVYAIITLVNTVSVTFSMLYIRKLLISRFGEINTGYWQAVWSIGEIYLGFITMFLSVYFYPRITSLLNKKETLKKEMRTTVLFVALISSLIIILTYILKRKLILILYSNNFIESLLFFKSQLIGDFLKIVSWVYGYYLLAITATRVVVISTTLIALSFSFLTNLLTNRFGILGVNYAYIIVYFCYLVFVLFYYRKKINE